MATLYVHLADRVIPVEVNEQENLTVLFSTSGDVEDHTEHVALLDVSEDYGMLNLALGNWDEGGDWILTNPIRA